MSYVECSIDNEELEEDEVLTTVAFRVLNGSLFIEINADDGNRGLVDDGKFSRTIKVSDKDAAVLKRFIAMALP